MLGQQRASGVEPVGRRGVMKWFFGWLIISSNTWSDTSTFGQRDRVLEEWESHRVIESLQLQYAVPRAIYLSTFCSPCTTHDQPISFHAH